METEININVKYSKNCSQCNELIIYNSKQGLRQSKVNKVICKSCREKNLNLKNKVYLKDNKWTKQCPTCKYEHSFSTKTNAVSYLKKVDTCYICNNLSGAYRINTKIKLHNIVYKTTNKVNGKTYIGVHATDNLNDGYIGNGVAKPSDIINKTRNRATTPMIAALLKYGYNNFSREILYSFKTIEECYKKEEELVTKEWIESKDNYNVSLGGCKAPSTVGKSASEKTKEKLKLNRTLTTKEYVVVSPENKVYFINGLTAFCKEHNLPNAGFSGVLNGRYPRTSKDWWICYKEDWKGYVFDRKDFKDYKHQIKYKDFYLYRGVKKVFFSTVKEACDFLSAKDSSIHCLLKGSTQSVKNYKKDSHKIPYHVLKDKEAKKYFLEHIKQGCNKYNLNFKVISNLIEGRSKITKTGITYLGIEYFDEEII